MSCCVLSNIMISFQYLIMTEFSRIFPTRKINLEWFWRAGLLWRKRYVLPAYQSHWQYYLFLPGCWAERACQGVHENWQKYRSLLALKPCTQVLEKYQHFYLIPQLKIKVGRRQQRPSCWKKSGLQWRSLSVSLCHGGNWIFCLSLNLDHKLA